MADITLQYQIFSDSDTDFNEKTRYQDLHHHHHQLLKQQ